MDQSNWCMMKRSKFKVKGAPVLEARLAAATANRIRRIVEASEAPRHAVRALRMPLPKKPASDVIPFPAAIADLSHGEVRNLMSYYAAFYGYANSELGIWRSKTAVLTRTLRVRREILFQKYKPEKKTSDWSEAIQGRISKRPDIMKMEAMLGEAEAMVAILDPLVWTYQKWADIASRDISARATELEIGGRSGQRVRRK